MQAQLTRARSFAHTLWHPDTVNTNCNDGLLRLIAFLCMAIDHVGKMFFPQFPEMRMIGRLAFPLFAYGIAVGAVYTHNPMRYLSRVVLLALISQPLYALGLAHENAAMYAIPFRENPLGCMLTFYLESWQTPSILLSLALGLGILLSVRGKHIALALGLYVLCERFAGSLDYGIGGIRLMLLFYALCEHPLLCLLATTSYMIAWALKGSGYVIMGIDFNIRIYSLPAFFLCCMPMQTRLHLPRWFVYGFYPAHLAVLALLVKCF